jgi:hypothetical protein
MYNHVPMPDGKIQMQTITHGYKDYLVPDDFQNVMSKVFQDTE